jgi:S-disulfanyl-L-cysteine oxidoreductase SoxD
MEASVMSMPSPSSRPRSGLRLVLTGSLFIGGIMPLWTTLEAAPEGPKLGVSMPQESIRDLDISVFPDGTGLPQGKGTAVEGKTQFEALCTRCHGVKGSGGSAEELVGRSPLNGARPDQTVGNYWPYATTIFDYIRRAMPLNAPLSLSNDQVYALTAYLLYLNAIVTDTEEMNAITLKAVQMPNRDGFYSVWGNGGH